MISQPVQYLTITAEQQQQRIDNFLMARFKTVPKSRIYQMLRKGEVRVNKKRVKALYKLQCDDMVRIPPIHMQEEAAPLPASPKLLAELAERIIFENEQILVINKPAGLAVHAGSGVSIGLIEALWQLYPQHETLSLVHRLDRGTSGCLLLGKNLQVLRQLQQLLRDRTMRKVYRLLVVGHWPEKLTTVTAPLRKNSLLSGERVVRVDTVDGKDATTQFRVLQRFEKLTLLEAIPVTGRTHQIRVHAAYAGYPILGDDKYGIDDANKHYARQGHKRLCLHAYSLKFCLPGSGESGARGESIEVTAQRDAEFSAVAAT